MVAGESKGKRGGGNGTNDNWRTCPEHVYCFRTAMLRLRECRLLGCRDCAGRRIRRSNQLFSLSSVVARSIRGSWKRQLVPYMPGFEGVGGGAIDRLLLGFRPGVL